MSSSSHTLNFEWLSCWWITIVVLWNCTYCKYRSSETIGKHILQQSKLGFQYVDFGTILAALPQQGHQQHPALPTVVSSPFLKGITLLLIYSKLNDMRRFSFLIMVAIDISILIMLAVMHILCSLLKISNRLWWQLALEFIHIYQLQENHNTS